MKIDLDLIAKLENLARLELTEDERKVLRKDLQEMIAMVSKLEELDLADVEPLRHVTEVTNVLREDKVEGQLNQEKVFLNAPDREGSYFRVPKVIDRKEE